MSEPMTADTLKDDSFTPIKPDWKWKPGDAFRMKTPIPADEYTLTIVRPVTFEDLQKLVDNIIAPKRRDLFKLWFEELQKHNLIDVASFQQAIEQAKHNGNGQGHSTT